MKIIGQSEDTYIIEASKNEVARLIGYHSKYINEAKVSVGDQIQVNSMYDQLYNLKRNETDLNKVVSTLRNLADLLEPVCPVIERSIKEAGSK